MYSFEKLVLVTCRFDRKTGNIFGDEETENIFCYILTSLQFPHTVGPRELAAVRVPLLERQVGGRGVLRPQLRPVLVLLLGSQDQGSLALVLCGDGLMRISFYVGLFLAATQK